MRSHLSDEAFRSSFPLGHAVAPQREEIPPCDACGLRVCCDHLHVVPAIPWYNHVSFIVTKWWRNLVKNVDLRWDCWGEILSCQPRAQDVG